MENVNVFPMVYKHRVNAAGEVPVVICVTLKNKPILYEPLRRKIRLSDWDPDKRVSKSNKLLNALIEKRRSELLQDFTKAELLGTRLTKSTIKIIASGDAISKDFYAYAEHVLETKKLSDGNGYSQDTKRRYKDEIKRMKQYKPELFFGDITTSFLRSYQDWLQNTHLKKDETKLHKNSIWKALAFIRMVWNQAIKEEIIKPDNYPFKNIVGTYEADLTKIKYLELTQIEEIERLLIERAEELDTLTIQIGWRFLTMCVFGMRISDAMRLNDAFINDTGQMDFKPHKTRRHGNVAKVPIVSERQQRYLENTFKFPVPQKDPKSFRTIFNQHLKIIAQLAKIKINLTSHIGRHTMGAFLVDVGVQEKAAMAMLGVKSNRVIKTYMHLKESKLIEEANKLKNIF